MFSNMFMLCSFGRESSRKKKVQYSSRRCETSVYKEFDLRYPAIANSHRSSCFPLDDQFEFNSQYTTSDNNSVDIKGKRRNKDSGTCRVQRAATSWLRHPLLALLQNSGRRCAANVSDGEDEAEVEGGSTLDVERRKEAEILGVVIDEVFDVVWSIQRAYLNLQDGQCSWDSEKARAADAAAGAELRRLAILRERFRREARAAQGVKMEMEATKVKVEMLRKKLSAALLSGYRKRCRRAPSKIKVSCCTNDNVAASPAAPELFELTARQVREASQSFGSLLLSLMRYAHWDMAAAVHSITATTGTAFPTIGAHHARYALESYISRKLFQGFNHETFHMVNDPSSTFRMVNDPTLTFNTDHHRFRCFAQYLEMKSMDPMDLLGASPNRGFGKFCAAKYLSVVHPKMEESFFGSLKQYRLVRAGEHPKTEFYREFLRLAKSVWLLHLLAFSLDPAPSPFEARQGAQFCPQYMESVVDWTSGQVPKSRNIVGFPVGMGFKLGNESIIKARVYLVS